MSTHARRSTLLVLALFPGLGACDASQAFAPPDPDSFVVQAFLFAGEPVTQVTVTGVLPVDADSTAVPEPITDASIWLTREGVRHELVPTEGAPGSYHDPGDGLSVEPGDPFHLEVRWRDQVATAETVVPRPPSGLALSADSLAAPSSGGGPGGGFGDPFSSASLVARWSNPDNELHYVVVDNVESDPEPVPSSGLVSRVAPRIILPPTPADSSNISARSLTHLGLHRVRLYRVNDEYADLYRGLQQDSRDLNEPPSNIDGALGVFSAFAADSAFFRFH